MKKYKKESLINGNTAPLQRHLLFSVQLILALMMWSPIRAQGAQQPDVWEPLKYFVVSWEGMAKGQPGISARIMYRGDQQREHRRQGIGCKKRRPIFDEHRSSPTLWHAVPLGRPKCALQTLQNGLRSDG
jgi:hypothetical protein